MSTYEWIETGEDYRLNWKVFVRRLGMENNYEIWR